MNEQANIDLVRQCYDAFNKGDFKRLLGSMAQDIDWEVPSIEAIPFSGKRHGLDQVADFFRLMGQLQEAHVFELHDFIAQGDRVIVLGHYEWTVKTNGVDFRSDFAHVFTVANGKIAKFKEFMDSHQAALAYHAQTGAGAGARPDADRPTMH